LITLTFIIDDKAWAEINFEDVTKISRISYNSDSYGSAWGDVNSDGWPDLFTGNHGVHRDGPQLFLNNKDGTFKDFSLQQNIERLSKDLHTASWADFDNDGDDDLFIIVGAWAGFGNSSNILLINTNGVLQFESGAFGLDYPYGRGRIPVWVDWNNDGLLDIILINHPREDKKAPTTLFVNNGTGFEIFETFEEKGTGYISNLLPDEKLKFIFLSTPPHGLYSVNEDPIKNEINKLNLKKDWANDIVIADFNGDLLPDVYRTTGDAINPLKYDIFEINVNEDGFKEKSREAGFTDRIPCRGVVAGDFDNDMDLDLYLACSVRGCSRVDCQNKYDNNLPNILYENYGDGTFKKVDNAGGAEGTNLGSEDTVTIVDYDNDGFLDLFVTNGEDVTQNSYGPHQLFRNLGNDNHWLEVDLKGIVSNADGIGSRILVTTDEKTQLREQNGGMHSRSQDYQRIHFGLGNHTNIQSILVYWPSGMISGIKDVSSNQILEIVEPEFPPTPYQQMDLGIKMKEIVCKKNLEKMIKLSSDKVTCVTSSSMKKLLERNWGIIFP